MLFALARPRLAQLAVFAGGFGDEAFSLRIGQQFARHTHRSASVEHVDYGALIGRLNPQRSVHLAGGRPADQQGHGHTSALHFLSDGHHLIKAGGDKTR